MIAANDPRHSFRAGYYAGCRLQCCKDAMAADKRTRTAWALANPLPPDDPRHGRPSTYTNGRCHCDRCTAAWADNHREYMHADPVRLIRHAERQRRYYYSKRKGD